uniref:EF-hand domain-containing protein n=1 Tax=Meloidogyne hapla TaxID=6305 RepID=A0A1I8BEM8_MELHA
MVTEKENQTSIKRRRKLQTITEECRLRSALLTDKFKVVDTFCQLLIATDGHLRVEEMTLLVDVFREKQMNDSPYVMDELWGFVLEELRVDCAEAFEIVMVTRGTNVCCEETGEEEVRKLV